MNEDEIIISYPDVDNDDLDQEIALAKLEGIENPSRWLLYKKLQRELYEYSLTPELEMIERAQEGVCISIFSPPDRTLNETAIKTLASWMSSLPSRLETAVWEYLQIDTEEAYQAVCSKLEAYGYKLHRHKTASNIRRKTYADMIYDALPATMEDLLDLPIESKRPAATIRQTLRRFRDHGLVVQDGLYWRHKESE